MTKKESSKSDKPTVSRTEKPQKKAGTTKEARKNLAAFLLFVAAVIGMVALLFIGYWIGRNAPVLPAQATYTPLPTYTHYPTVEPQPAVVPETSVTDESAGEEGGCPSKAIRNEPQGLSQSDGSFVAQFGTEGCVTVFEGRIWEQDKGIQNRHDIVMIDGARDGFHYWEGNGWLIPSSWNPQEFACLIWEQKQENWISQGIDPLQVKFWYFDPAPTCSPVEAVTNVAQPETSTETTPWPITADAAANLFGGNASRWEQVSGRRWHLKEDPVKVTLKIPDYAQVEGWDGNQTIELTNGPITVTVVGATVYPR